MANYSHSTDYFGLNKIVSLIICLFIGGIMGAIVRLLEGKMVAGLVRLVACFFGIGFIMNVVDFVMILLNGKILRVL